MFEISQIKEANKLFDSKKREEKEKNRMKEKFLIQLL